MYVENQILCKNKLISGTESLTKLFETFFVKSTSFWALVGKSKCFYSKGIRNVGYRTDLGLKY